MASERVIAIKHAQAAEDSANALKQMANELAEMRTQLSAAHEKIDSLLSIVGSNDPAALFDQLNDEAKRRNLSFASTVTATKSEAKKGG